MTRRNFMALLATLAVSTVAAAPAPDVFTVRVKMISAGKVTLVPVGELTRVGNKVTLRALAAPSIDQLSDRFIAAWKAYARPASVTITESIASDTGMRPAHNDYSFTFTPKDRLYMAAVIKEFVAGLKYEALGMTSIHFIERDMTREYPPGANDRAAQIINIRKGTKLDTSAGFESFFIKAPVRPSGNGTPSSVLRVSASDPRIGVAQNWDDGTVTIAWLKLFADNHVEIVPIYAGEQFVSGWGAYDAKVDVEVPIIKDGSWTKIVVKKTSPQLVEARIVDFYESHAFYDVTPVIDPALLR